MIVDIGGLSSVLVEKRCNDVDGLGHMVVELSLPETSAACCD